MGWRGAKPEMSSKCSKLWVSLLPNSGSADTWHPDDGNDGSDEEESYDKDGIYWAITVLKAHAKHFAYAFFKSLQTTLWRLLLLFPFVDGESKAQVYTASNGLNSPLSPVLSVCQSSPT